VSQTLVVRNQQRTQRLQTKYLRLIVRELLTKELRRQEFELGIAIVGNEAMTRLNETYLRHQGSTDVITFDYEGSGHGKKLAGEIFVCLEEAKIQAPRFGMTWQNELARYIVHGVLHLCGYDDKIGGARRKMKREENRLMRRLTARFNLERIKGEPRRGRTAARTH